jgi:aminopeptidase-like protein
MKSMNTIRLHPNHPEYQTKAWALLEKLFPIYRTLMGEGYERSLDIISEIIPLRILAYPSGSKCGSWLIPQEWEIRDAFILDEAGNKIVDFKKSPFHIWQYSIPFHGKIHKDELMSRLRTASGRKDAIPLVVTYYNRNWGFSVSAEQLEKMTNEIYEVYIGSSFKDGYLKIGEFFLPGQKREEIIIDAVLSCASLANNLSGVVVAVMLADLIKNSKDRIYSYRFLFTPETIGPIALHYLYPNFGKNVIGAYNLANLGDSGDFNYKKSRQGNTISDKAMIHTLKISGKRFHLQEYDVMSGTCGNEKAYNSLGVELPLGALRRSPLNSYPEYDTSKDDLAFVNADSLFESLRICHGAFQAIERSIKYKHQFEGEPFLTGYGLFPKFSCEKERVPYDYLMAFTTGELTLVDIAEKAGLAVTDFDDAVRLMEEKGLISRVL